MQIVIEIPENEVPDCQEIISMNLHFIHKEVCECTYPFKVLPKGHGRLKDVDALLRKHPLFDTYPFPSTTIDNAPTIIEADNAGRKRGIIK